MRFAKLIAAVALLFPTASMAVVIDFNTAVGDPDGYSEQGVTFSYIGTAAGNTFFSNSPNGSRAITMSGDRDGKMRADISGGASSVAVDLGDFNADPDRLILEIYDSADTLLDSITQDIAASFIGMVTLSRIANDIAYAIFGTTGELGLGGIYADNFTFDRVAVPEPSTVLLMGIGILAGVAWTRRRRHHHHLAG